MGNRARRKKLAELIRKTGGPKLYRGPKLSAYREINLIAKGMLHRLRFSVGDIINDCDGFNHAIIKVLWEKNPIGRHRWSRHVPHFVTYFDQFELEHGRWSCGCPWSPDPAIPWQQIEAFTLKYLAEQDVPNASWPLTERQVSILQALRAGNRITDDDGRLLAEFREL